MNCNHNTLFKRDDNIHESNEYTITIHNVEVRQVPLATEIQMTLCLVWMRIPFAKYTYKPSGGTSILGIDA